MEMWGRMTNNQKTDANIAFYKIVVDTQSELYKQCQIEVDKINANVRKGTKLNIDDWYMSHCFENIQHDLQHLDGSKEIDCLCLSSPKDYCLFQIGEGQDLIRVERLERFHNIEEDIKTSKPVIIIAHSTNIASIGNIGELVSSNQSVQNQKYDSGNTIPDYLSTIIKTYNAAEIAPMKPEKK